MIPAVAACFNRLRVAWQPPTRAAPPPVAAPLPLAHPDQPLPAWVATGPVVQKDRALLGPLPWGQFPGRPTDRPWPGPIPAPRAPFVAAYLVRLHEGKRYMSDPRAYLLEHPALVYLLGFPRHPAPTAPGAVEVARSVPDRRRLSRVLRTLPKPALQFLLTATVQHLRATLPPDQQPTFGDTIAGDTQALLAWVEENNPKQFIAGGRLDKTRQPAGDPGCTLGVKARANRAPAEADADPPAPTTAARPAGQSQVGGDIRWGYASGIVVTRLPDGLEVVLADRPRPFHESDPSSFFPLMAQVADRLGRRPRYGTGDAAFDAPHVYDCCYQAGGWAAVPLVESKRGGHRHFDPDGRPPCAAGLAMPRLFTYQQRTGLVPHEREKCGCPLLYPRATGAPCPIADPHFPKGGGTTTIATSAGARIRHQLDRESDDYQRLYAQRTMVERLNSQAAALGVTHPKLRRGRAIANQNTLIHVLINPRSAAPEARPATDALTRAA